MTLKIIIDCYNKKINTPSSNMLLMEVIWKLSQELNIYDCRHVYKEANKTTDCLAKKRISILYTSVWYSNFLKDVTNISFEEVLLSIVFVRTSFRSLLLPKKKKKNKPPYQSLL